MPDSLGGRLAAIWVGQKGYNDRVKSVQKENRWNEVYLLGLVGEVNEILDASGWKRHKRSSVPNPVNIGRELADATKYLLSLWQEYGFTPEQMLQHLELKQAELDKQWKHDWEPPSGRNVLVTDLDGTVADYRRSFSEYARRAGYDLSKTLSLQMDTDNSMPYGEYSALKDKFESEGGYEQLYPYEDAISLLKGESKQATIIYVTTARPVDKYQRIWSDTAAWLERYGVGYDMLRFGDDIRLEELAAMRSRGNRVCLLEDNPALALRAAGMGFHVLLRAQEYNKQAVHPNIERVQTFDRTINWDWEAK